MSQEKTDDPVRLRQLGIIDLPTIQRYINFHSSVTVDLFGSDVSSNAATFYTTGLKGRYEEARQADDHLLKDMSYKVFTVDDGQLQERDAPALNALNERLRDDFMKDSQAGVDRWNRVIQKQGIEFRFYLPHKAFHRQIGPLAGLKISPLGKVISDADWAASMADWLPTDQDRKHVQSLMNRVIEPGKFANWIAPPPVGVNRQPASFQYVRFA
jgi:benzoyl-CoA 2,3-dioxygenase component B